MGLKVDCFFLRRTPTRKERLNGPSSLIRSLNRQLCELIFEAFVQLTGPPVPPGTFKNFPDINDQGRVGFSPLNRKR